MLGTGETKEPAMRHLGSELRLGGREDKKVEDNKWDGKKKNDLDDLSIGHDLSDVLILPRHRRANNKP